MDGIDPCAVLGIRPSATAEDIKRAYRARLLATHPDRGGKREDAEAVIGAFRQLQRKRPNPFLPPVVTVERDRCRPQAARRRPVRKSFAAVLADVQLAQGIQR
jgi:hypothetical protein